MNEYIWKVNRERVENMLKKILLLTVCVAFSGILLAGCTDSEIKEASEMAEKIAEEAEDQARNIADSQDSHVLGVKNGHPFDYPDQTYGDAFEDFFSYPTWKYFVGTKEGADEDGDGKPDYEEKNVDIVEFTGYCTYLDTEVKAQMQFTLDEESDTFEVTYLSFNDVPQNMLMLYGLLDTVFAEGEADVNAEPNENAETNVNIEVDAQTQEESIDTDEKANGNISASRETLPGSYSRERGPKCGLSIWSADENGIFFAMGIGSSGYRAYVDMRDCTAAWTGENTAVYMEEYGDRHYSLTFTIQKDGCMVLNENVPYSEDFPLAGFYLPDDLAEGNCERVFLETDVFPIDASELEGKTAAECKIARNEIYALHGRRFNDEQLQGYFETCSWYNGTIAPENFSDSALNEVEKANLQIISEYEAKMGY